VWDAVCTATHRDRNACIDRPAKGLPLHRHDRADLLQHERICQHTFPGGFFAELKNWYILEKLHCCPRSEPSTTPKAILTVERQS
jgi:hypothetical protein